MKRLAGLTLLAALILGVAVPAQQDAPVAEPHPYYPLKVGTEWKYRVQGGPITVKVAAAEKAGAFQGFKLETSAGGKVSASETVAYTPEGVKRFNVNMLAPEQPILFLPKDPDATKSWKVDTKVAGQTITGTFTASKTSVTVPAGTYPDAIHVRGEGMQIGSTTTTVEYWFAKDIGIVKLKFTLGTQDATLELEEFKAGK
jgi:hypothetical protein